MAFTSDETSNLVTQEEQKVTIKKPVDDAEESDDGFSNAVINFSLVQSQEAFN